MVNILKAKSGLFNFPGQLIKLNYFIFSGVGKISQDFLRFKVIYFIEYCTWIFYIPSVAFAYGQDFFTTSTTSILYPNSRLLMGKQDTILILPIKLLLNLVFTAIIVVAKVAKVATLQLIDCSR